MLQNIVLYMTSTAAQVWAAIMVFEVVVLRDVLSRNDAELGELWNKAREYWQPLIHHLKDRNAPTLFTRLGEFGLDEQTLLGADTDKACFTKFIKAIKEHRLVILDNKAATFRDRGENLSPANWQAKFDPIAVRVAKLEAVTAQPAHAFAWGCLAIVLNLLAMGLAGTWQGSEAALWVTVVTVFTVNIAIGALVAPKAYRAILN